MSRLRPMSLTLNAGDAALAWYNAFLATSQEEGRPLLNRTLSVELFTDGVQFVATDGVLLFRTWVPAWQETVPWPGGFRSPKYAVVVMDRDHFALGFMKALMAATKESVKTLTIAVEVAPQPEAGEPAIGEEFSRFCLTLRALGQQLHCRLFEARYPDWRAFDLGIPMLERVEGVMLSPRVCATLGKVKGAGAFALDFEGVGRCLLSDPLFKSVEGIVMPMRRPEKKRERELDQQIEIAASNDGVPAGKVRVDGQWVPATPENQRRAREAAAARRDR